LHKRRFGIQGHCPFFHSSPLVKLRGIRPLARGVLALRQKFAHKHKPIGASRSHTSASFMATGTRISPVQLRSAGLQYVVASPGAVCQRTVLPVLAAGTWANWASSF
jgi:hypothetical protein